MLYYEFQRNIDWNSSLLAEKPHGSNVHMIVLTGTSMRARSQKIEHGAWKPLCASIYDKCTYIYNTQMSHARDRLPGCKTLSRPTLEFKLRTAQDLFPCLKWVLQFKGRCCLSMACFIPPNLQRPLQVTLDRFLRHCAYHSQALQLCHQALPQRASRCL